MKRHSLSSFRTQVRRATEAASSSNHKLCDLVDEFGQELAFRSRVSGTIEQYRRELASGAPRSSLKDVLDTVEAFLVVQAMESTSGNIAQAAELLQMPEATLRYRMGKHGLR